MMSVFRLRNAPAAAPEPTSFGHVSYWEQADAILAHPKSGMKILPASKDHSQC